MSAKWVPADNELDALARDLPLADRGGDRVEQERTGLLAEPIGGADLLERQLPLTRDRFGGVQDTLSGAQASAIVTSGMRHANR